MEMRVLRWIVFCLMTSILNAGTVEQHLESLKTEDKVDLGVKKGLAWMSRQQDPSSGVFHGSLPNTFTGLACIAYMAAGEQVGRTTFGENLRKGLMFLVRSAKRNKYYFGREGKGRMYAHGIVTLALCEAYGMMEKEEENRQLKIVIEKAIEVILKSQCKKEGRDYGGWRYEPRSDQGADLSVSVWQALVLRSAKNSQLKIPELAIDEAIQYIKKTYCQKTQSFTYQGTEKHNTPAMNSAGIVAMNCLGMNKEKKDKQMIETSARFLEKFNPNHGGHYYYQSYYVGAAANMLGDETRGDFLPKLEQALLKLQMQDGQFKQHGGAHGGVYSTAFALISLCMRYQYLPIYQE
jgi:hypothetical protein